MARGYLALRVEVLAERLFVIHWSHLRPNTGIKGGIPLNSYISFNSYVRKAGNPDLITTDRGETVRSIVVVVVVKRGSRGLWERTFSLGR
jgi:hypothetical protein